MNRRDKMTTQILERDYFVICSHIDPDGDAVGSCLGLWHALKKINKKAVVCLYSKIPERYRFLPGCDAIVGEIPANYCNLISIDAPNINRLGFSETDWKNSDVNFTFNIDHHESNCSFGDLVMVDSSACASAELIFDLIRELDITMDRDICTCLFTGITTDTGCFKYSNSTAKSHIYAAECIAQGIDQELIMKEIYASFPIARLELETMVMSTLKIKNRVAWACCDLDMLNKCGYDDTEDIVNRLVEIRDADIAVFFREPEKNVIKASLRSSGAANVSQIAANFGGGGHAKAAGAKMNMPMSEAVEKALKYCFTHLEQQKNGSA